MPDELLRGLLDKSYRLVLAGFPKRRQREILGLSCCGADCTTCDLFGGPCRGCNAAEGRVFHALEGKPCPIYACCVNRRRHATCAACEALPCDIWRATRDPNLSDEAFEASMEARVRNLRGE